MRQINNIFNAANIPPGINALIVFADVTAPSTGFPTVEGYINILDGGHAGRRVLRDEVRGHGPLRELIRR